MSSSPTPNASPAKATSTCSESDTSTDNDDPPLYSKATAIQPPPRKRLRTEDDGGKVSSASNLHAPASALMNLPLDVLLEILSHVDPMSLRHVSRTSQALRDTLAGPKSNWIWRASYANTDHGLPSVPNDMTVPQFLSFLVDRVCDFCQECPSPDHCQPCYREYPRALVERLAAEFSQVADKKAWLIKREKEHENVLEVRACHGVKRTADYKLFDKQHAGTCSRWDLKQLWKRQAMTKEVREERVREITKRMRRLEMGCEESAAIKDEQAWQLRHGSARRYFCVREGDHGHYSIPDGIYDLIHKCEPLADDGAL
ncbi:hypothetical protein GGG16DRAFT_118756 [Schizophyllum commune]